MTQEFSPCSEAVVGGCTMKELAVSMNVRNSSPRPNRKNSFNSCKLPNRSASSTTSCHRCYTGRQIVQVSFLQRKET